jgi:hypothetical protein
VRAGRISATQRIRIITSDMRDAVAARCIRSQPTANVPRIATTARSSAIFPLRRPTQAFRVDTRPMAMAVANTQYRAADCWSSASSATTRAMNSTTRYDGKPRGAARPMAAGEKVANPSIVAGAPAGQAHASAIIVRLGDESQLFDSFPLMHPHTDQMPNRILVVSPGVEQARIVEYNHVAIRHHELRTRRVRLGRGPKQ